MKITLLTLFLLLNAGFNPGLKISSKGVFLSIDKKTKSAQLKKYSSELLKKNIILEIEDLRFSSDGNIEFIKINVDCKDGFKGSASESFKKNDKAIGFYRIYNAGNSSPFGMSPTPED